MPTRPRTVQLPTLTVKEPKDLRRPDAFFVCRALGVAQWDIATEAKTSQGVVAATFGGSRNDANVKAATVKVLKKLGHTYTVEELFDDEAV